MMKAILPISLNYVIVLLLARHLVMLSKKC